MKLSLKTIKTLIREELKKIEGDAETEEEMHIFDFDDTLGVTNAMTLVTGIEKISDNDYRVIKDLDKRIKGNGIESSTVTDKTDLIGAFNQYLRGSGKSSSHLPKQFGDLAGAEVAVLDTDAYAKWKNNYKPVYKIRLSIILIYYLIFFNKEIPSRILQFVISVFFFYSDITHI